MKGLALQSVHVRNFKAIEDSSPIKLTPLTFLVGENGSGKSSLIEALYTLQRIVLEDLDEAMKPCRGFGEIWHKGSRHGLRSETGVEVLSNPMTIGLSGRGLADDEKLRSYQAETAITRTRDQKLLIVKEHVSFAGWYTYTRDHTGAVTRQGNGRDRGRANKANGGENSAADPIFRKGPGKSGVISRIPEDESLLSSVLFPALNDWQFVTLVPQRMGEPTAVKQSGATILLDNDGGNIAEYLLNIKSLDERAFRGIVETLQYILPYAKDLTAELTSELESQVYLKMVESGYSVPGWLFSSGTLRVLAIIALLRHPDPQPLIVIEEIENGLDPRAAQLIVEEIRTAVDSGRVQVILTTHSPYLLNLLSLDQVVLVERDRGQTRFSRPADRDSLDKWTRNYAPGELYTMGVLNES